MFNKILKLLHLLPTVRVTHNWDYSAKGGHRIPGSEPEEMLCISYGIGKYFIAIWKNNGDYAWSTALFQTHPLLKMGDRYINACSISSTHTVEEVKQIALSRAVSFLRSA